MTPIRDLTDTARWVALYRALESERADAHFQDPLARRLAGDRGVKILGALPRSMRNAAWSVVARTVVIDRLIQRQVASGVDMVINLAAGLDTRPYRLPLPPTLRWIEVDNPALLEEKTNLLASEAPHCLVERVPLDLKAEAPRRQLVQRLGGSAGKVLVLSEGLLMYLPTDAVAGLARELRQVPSFQSWITDIISPGLLRMIEKDWGSTLRDGDAQMHFAPVDGAAFFETCGWQIIECTSTFAAARTLHRLPWLLRLFAVLPGSERYHPNRPWSGICLLRPTTP